MRTKYFEELKKIRDIEKELVDLLIMQYKMFEDYLKDKDENHIYKIKDLEDDVNRKASDIERYSYDLLALQQPVAKDLSFLQKSIKMASNTKRIGNHLSQAGIIVIEFPLKDQEEFFVEEYIENQKSMILGASEAFFTNDKKLAQEIIEKDEINNKLFEKAIEYLVELTKDDRIKAKELSEKVLFFKYFERIGDRIARSAEFAKRL